MSKPNSRQGRVGSVGHDLFEQWVYSIHGTQIPILESQIIVELGQNSFFVFNFLAFSSSKQNVSFFQG